MADVYRKNISPQRGSDRTNQIMTVHTPAHWFLLAGLVLVCVGFTLWAFFGSLSKTAAASGLYHPGSSKYGEILAFMPLATGKTVDVGMDVTVTLSGYSMQEFGHMKGTVTYVDDFVASADEIYQLLEDEILANSYIQNGPSVAVVCKLQEDKSAENGFYWSNERGKRLKIHDGTGAQLTIVEETTHPIQLGFPQLREYFR